MCKRGLVTTGLCFSAALLGWAQHTEAGADKVTICHKADSVKYFVITVGAPSVPAHLDHGDCVVDDGVACTVDSCDAGLGCVYAPDDGACDDGDACTADSCDAATGCVNTTISCDDGDACTADSCDPATGCVNTDISCDDGDACTADSCNPATGCVNTDNIVCGDGVVCAPEECETNADCQAGFICDLCECIPE